MAIPTSASSIDMQRAYRRRVGGLLVLIFVILPLLYVAGQVVLTLQTLDRVERERDEWQRPAQIIQSLDVHPGNVMVDLGSGAGYFSLKVAPLIGGDGRVLAVDLRRESLAFLWIRAVLRGQRNVRVIHGEVDDPNLPPGPVDAVLVANTYHELAQPEPVLRALEASMRSGARLVVVDRAPRSAGEAREADAAHHEITAAAAADDIGRHGFEVVAREDRFIDRPADDDVWWLIVFRKP
jgi:predicted methyltransferase